MKTDELLQSLAGQLFDTASDAMFIMAAEPDEVFRCIAVNKPYLEKTKLEADQVIGKTHIEILPKNAVDTAFKGYLTAIKTKKTNRYIERVDFGFGLDIVETTITPVFDKAGKCTHLIGASRDITALTETETKLGLMTQTLQSVNDGVSITDLDNKIIYANDAFCKMYGYKNQEEIINKDISIVCSPECENSIQKISKATIDGGWNGELINIKKDGSSFPIRLSASPIVDHNGNIFALVGICNDISEEKETRQKLQTHEKWIQSIAENSPDIIYVYNVDERRNVYYNHSILGYLGYNKNELDEYAPGFFEKIIHPDDLPQYDEFFKTIGKWEKGRVFSFEYRVKTKTGEWRWFKGSEKEFERSQGRVISMIGTAQDITEMKAARDALSRSEEKYRLLADNSSDAIALYNKNYKLLYLSPATVTLSGYSIHELLEMDFMDIVYPPDREALQKKIQVAVANKVKQDSLIYRFVQKNSNIVWVETNSNRLFDDNGNLKQIITVNRDITLRKKAEEVLEERNNKFRFLSRSVTEMLELPDLHSVYNYMITNLHSQYPDTVALFVTINEELMETKLESIIGLDNKFLKKVIELSGQNPIGKTFTLLPSHQRMFKYGKFLSFDGGLKEFAATEFPAFASTILHKLLGIHKIYTIGINNNEKLLAAIHIFSLRNTVITDIDYVETFINQAGVIIQHKMIEEQLRFQSMILEQIQDRVTVTDLHGNISYVNNSAIQMLKMKPEDLIGKSVTSYGNDESSRKKQQEIIDGTLKNGTWQGEVENFDANGNKSILDVRTQLIKNTDNEPVALCGISTDITRRKAQDLIIKQGEERYRNLFNSMTEGFSLCKIITDEAYNPIDWQFLELNPAHEKHTTIKNADLIGKRITEVYPDIESHWIDFYGKVALTGKSARMENYNKNTGHYYEVNAFCTSIGYFAVVFNNITDRKLTQQKLTEAKEKAEAANNLKTAFLNNISHEVRTPLNGILGFSELFSQPDTSEDDKKMYLQILEDSTNRLLQTITDYMDISLLTSNTQTVNPVKIDPAGLMQEITKIYSVRCAKKSLEFTLLLPEEMKDVTIETDRTLLTKAIRHLLDNAVKFTLQGKVTAGFTTSNNTITIFVTDTGVGISPDMKHAVFNNFVQEHTSTNRSYEGSGLGLSIVKKIAELLNYELHVESSKNVGTSVFLTLPLTEGQTKSVQEPTENTGFTITKKPLVLIVDDDQYSLTLLGSILPLLNIEFVKAHNGKQAVEACDENPAINLVLMDLKMRDMDGLEATRIIKSRHPGLPVIAQTAHALAGDKKKALDAGCDDYLTKPIRKAELKEKLARFGLVSKGVTGND